MTSKYINKSYREALVCLEIRHPLFSADLLLQGAQLLSYQPAGEKNWLWLSDLAEYKSGTSVRGGIPLCWPWFGNADKNPAPVQHSIADVAHAPAHGFARTRDWTLSEVEEDDEAIMLILTLADTSHPNWQAELAVEAEFRFTESSLSLTLTTENNSTAEVTFSQALHSYFPTDDISRTQIEGFEGETYIDALDNWSEKTQQGPVQFSAETDRIYYGEEPVSLITPNDALELNSQGSNSSVVWNPWIDKAKRLSQFDDAAYQKMFCVETANALNDAITLAEGESHSLSLLLARSDG